MAYRLRAVRHFFALMCDNLYQMGNRNFLICSNTSGQDIMEMEVIDMGEERRRGVMADENERFDGGLVTDESCGLDRREQADDRLDGFLIADMAQFLEVNEQSYIERFKKVLDHKPQFNLSAAIGVEFWLIYKKMYAPGLLLAALRMGCAMALIYEQRVGNQSFALWFGAAVAVLYTALGAYMGLGADQIYWKHTVRILKELKCRDRKAEADEVLYGKIKELGRTSLRAAWCMMVVYIVVMSAIWNKGEMARQRMREEQEELREQSLVHIYDGGLHIKYDPEYWSMDSGILAQSDIPALIFTHNSHEGEFRATITTVEGHALSAQEFKDALSQIGRDEGSREDAWAQEMNWDIIHQVRSGYLLEKDGKDMAVRVNMKRVGDRSYLVDFEYPAESQDSEFEDQFFELWTESEMLYEVIPFETAPDSQRISSRLDRLVYEHMVKEGEK